MPYATLADILEQLPESDLIGLTDDPGVGYVDQSVVDRAIADADALIDAYCQGRYPVPMSPVVPVIRRIAVDLAIYNLHSRRAMEIPAARAERHKAALALLDRLADGRISLGGDAPVPADSGAAIVSGSGRLFTRASMRGH